MLIIKQKNIKGLFTLWMIRCNDIYTVLIIALSFSQNEIKELMAEDKTAAQYNKKNNNKQHLVIIGLDANIVIYIFIVIILGVDESLVTYSKWTWQR